jgi:hypothetical protein
MNDQDYIREGAKLANGWKIGSDTFNTYVYFSAWKEILPGLSQPMLDALAAQLVRQVDDTVGYYVDTYIGASVISSSHTGESIARIMSDDRTMNTIKAIVDSEVLK